MVRADSFEGFNQDRPYRRILFRDETQCPNGPLGSQWIFAFDKSGKRRNRRRSCHAEGFELKQLAAVVRLRALNSLLGFHGGNECLDRLRRQRMYSLERDRRITAVPGIGTL